MWLYLNSLRRDLHQPKESNVRIDTTPDYVPTNWIAAGYFATEAEIDAILGPDFDWTQSPTAEAMASGRSAQMCG